MQMMTSSPPSSLPYCTLLEIFQEVEDATDKGKATAQEEPAADSDDETILTIPQSTGGESSHKRPAEDEEEVVEDLRYQREFDIAASAPALTMLKGKHGQLRPMFRNLLWLRLKSRVLFLRKLKNNHPHQPVSRTIQA
ncbi:hypothetical protein ACLB2K_015988 [Fragaria x ananassa]